MTSITPYDFISNWEYMIYTFGKFLNYFHYLRDNDTLTYFPEAMDRK